MVFEPTVHCHCSSKSRLIWLGKRKILISSYSHFFGKLFLLLDRHGSQFCFEMSDAIWSARLWSLIAWLIEVNAFKVYKVGVPQLLVGTVSGKVSLFATTEASIIGVFSLIGLGNLSSGSASEASISVSSIVCVTDLWPSHPVALSQMLDPLFIISCSPYFGSSFLYLYPDILLIPRIYLSQHHASPRIMTVWGVGSAQVHADWLVVHPAQGIRRVILQLLWLLVSPLIVLGKERTSLSLLCIWKWVPLLESCKLGLRP